MNEQEKGVKIENHQNEINNNKPKSKFYLFTEQLYCRFQDDEVSALGAQLTYYLILAFFPFLIFIITLISYTNVTSDDILSYLNPILAINSYKVIQEFIQGILASENKTFLSFGMLGTIWAASSGILAIIKGLNKAYDEAENRPFWKVRGIAILFTLALGLVLIVAFIMLIFGKMIGEYMFKFLDFPDNFEAIWNVVKFVVPLSCMFIVFIYLYRILPNRRLSFREVIPGSLFSTFGWIITSVLFAFYVNNWDSYSKTYGSIGGIIVLLVWLYLSSIIILLGGEINATLSFLRDGQNKTGCKRYSLSLPFFKKK